MATTAPSSAASKARSDAQQLSRSKSSTANRARKPKQPEQGTEASQASQKPIPNYLKPTISSRPNPENFIRRSSNGDHEDLQAQNQKLLRRRSFDRPHSSSASSLQPRVQKSLHVSPGRPRERALFQKEKNLRSSSFHGTRTSSSAATKLNQHKAPKWQVSKATVNKKSSNASTSKKVSENDKALEEPENEEGKDQSAASSSPAVHGHEGEEVEELVKVDTEVELLDGEPQRKDKEAPVLEVVESEAHHEDQQEKKNNEVVEADQTEDPPPIAANGLINVKKETENQNTDAQKGVEQEKLEKAEKIDEKEEVVEDTNKCLEEEAEIDTEASQGDKEEEMTTTVTNTEETKEKDDGDVSKEKENGVEEAPSEDQTKAEPTEAEKVESEGSATAPKRQVVQGKKEPQSAYNDVIEETASKLLEKRKNKVRALVGAFETVIDYESGAK